MNFGSPIRSGLISVLTLAISFWGAEPCLAMVAMAQHPARCHKGMMDSHHGSASPAMNKPVRHRHQNSNAMPCCPEDSVLAPQQQGGTSCCDLGNAPTRPLVFLVSFKDLLFQLNANGPVGAAILPAQPRSGLPLMADAPRFIKPVSDLKTDLRI